MISTARYAFTLPLCIGALLVALVGCDDTYPVNPYNAPPQIEQMWAIPRAIPESGVSALTCLAVDADSDSLQYAWRTLYGHVSKAQEHAEYTPASGRVIDSVWCIVTDDQANSDSCQTLVLVSTTPLALHEIALFDDNTVPADWDTLDGAQLFNGRLFHGTVQRAGVLPDNATGLRVVGHGSLGYGTRVFSARYCSPWSDGPHSTSAVCSYNSRLFDGRGGWIVSLNGGSPRYVQDNGMLHNLPCTFELLVTYSTVVFTVFGDGQGGSVSAAVADATAFGLNYFTDAQWHTSQCTLDDVEYSVF